MQPWFFYGKKFGYIVAFKPHDAYDWWYETISDPETRRYVHRDSYFIPTDEDFQVREFQVKIKSFNVKGDGPYSLTKVIYYPRDGEDSFCCSCWVSIGEKKAVRLNSEQLTIFFFLCPSIVLISPVPIESPTDVYARPVSSTEALVWWLPVVDTGTGLQQYIEGYQVQS